MRMGVTVLYFASLRDAAGMASEQVATPASLVSLYGELRARHGFTLPAERLRVAVDGEFAAWDSVPRDGAEIAFIPPVSGG
jgi:molybdopterin synthase sulfur carrier subunit